MVFKLVRIDAENPSKIDLSIGKHVIGRGKFLHNDDADKRVSRNHAELEITEDNIILKSLHKNPCFYIKKTVPDTLLLHQDCTVSLSHGDRFGLIPDHFWYEVLYFTQDSAPESIETENRTENEVTNLQEERINENGVKNSPKQNGMAEESNDETNQNVTKAENDQGVETKDLNQDTVVTEVTNETDQKINENIAASQTKGNQKANENVAAEAMQTEALQSVDNGAESNISVNNGANEAEDDQMQSTEEYKLGIHTPSKRTHSDSTEHSPAQEKRVKTEPVEVKTEPVEVKMEHVDVADSSAGPSNGDQGSSKAESTDRPASPQKPSAPLRERCIYGASCYRRNPQHKAQFSHPCDSDWGSGERGVCPYGSACRRTDPRHWTTHHHPPGTLPGGHNTPGMRVVRRHGNIFFINAHTVNFYDDHFQVEDSDTDGESVDYDYEF